MSELEPFAQGKLKGKGERGLLFTLGVLIIIGGAVLGKIEEMILYLLLALAVFVIDRAEVGEELVRKKVRVALVISTTVIIGSLIQLLSSMSQPFRLHQYSLLTILIGGLLILIDGIRRYSPLGNRAGLI